MDANRASVVSRIQSVCVQNFWHLVCHRSSVAIHGSYLRVQLGKYDLFIHNHGDQLSCYVNKCPHRASRIVDAVFGESSLQCPYHGWSFQPSGTVVPRSDTFDNSPLDPRDARLDRWFLEDHFGFIFVALDPFFALIDQIGDESSLLLERIGSSIQHSHSSQVIQYETSWMLAVENALESYHVSKIHPKTLGTVGLDDGFDTLWDWSSLWRSSSTNKKISRISRFISSSVDIRNPITGYLSLYIFPFSMLSSTESLSFALQLYQPSLCNDSSRSTLLTNLYTPVVIDERMRDSVEVFYRSTAQMNFKIFEEDAHISSLVYSDSWSIEPLPYVSTLELKINHFRNCCKKAISLGSGKY